MEDYKEKYEKALEKASIAYKDEDRHQKATLERIFPELAESEDEKIREELINTINLAYDCGIAITIENRDKYLAWLEKQGEIIPSEDELEALRIAAYEPYKNWSEKLQSLYMKLSHCEQKPVKERVQPQPIKELNEESVTDLADYIEKLGKAYELNLPNRRYDIYAFAKDIINHLQINILQNRWSEEDEAIFTVIGSLILDNFSAEDASKTLTWLHSLTPHPQWKPSDEQMRVLDLAIRCGINRGTTEETTLVSLFNDLKKLK